MTVISTKSITGVTSITSPQSDDAVTLHTNDTTQRVSVTTGGINVTGVVTATSFSGPISGTTGTFSGDVSIADKIIHTGDTNTALRFPSADTIAAETGGTERLRITSDGDVGINVTPTNTDMAGVKPRLHILGISTAGQFNTVARFQSGPDNNDSGAAVVINHTNDRGLVIQGGRGGDADGSHHANSGLARFSIINNAGTFHKFMEAWGQNGQHIENISLFTGNQVERLRISSTGKVGINSTNPDQVLTVRAGSTPQILLKTTDASPALFVGDTIRTAEGQHLVEYRGNWDGTTVGRMVIVAGDDTGNKDNGEITFNTAAAGSTAERLRITSAGLIGIGTAAGGVSSNAILSIHSPSSSACRFNLTNTGSSSAESTQIWSQNNDLVFNTAGSERVRITDKGLCGNIVEKWLDFGLTHYDGSDWVDNGAGQQNRNAPSVNSDNEVTRFVFAASPYHSDFQSCTFWFGEAGNVSGNVFDIDFTVYHATATGGYSSNSSTFTKDLNAFSNGKVDKIVFHDDMPTVSANSMVQVNMDWTENTNGATCHCHGILIREWTIPHS